MISAVVFLPHSPFFLYLKTTFSTVLRKEGLLDVTIFLTVKKLPRTGASALTGC
jgi:hypothetical protein